MKKVKRLNSHLFPLKQIWLSVLLLLLTNSCFCQKINYLDIRDSIKTCGQAIDSLSINETLKRLESLDAHLLSKNIHVYYEDIAICYWVKARGKNEEYLRKGIAANLSALYYWPKSTKAMWNLAFSYAYLNDCTSARYYMAQCKKYTPKKYWDQGSKEQESSLFAKCE